MSHLKPIVVVLSVAMLIAASASAARSKRQRGARSESQANATRLDDPAQKAILAALDDEREAKAFYKAIIAKHGEIRPFSNIVEAEARHESALVALVEKYDIKTPADRWASRKVDVPETLPAAFREAIKLERENVEMYDGFVKSIQQEDIRSVMNQLRWASQERHLPALERHAGGGPGRGPGATGQGSAGRGIGGCCPACGRNVDSPAGQGRGAGWSGGPGCGRGMGWQGGRGGGWQGGQGRGQGPGWRGGRTE
ncbi:MAG: hypothetical protein NTU53_16315 [Planctomycetota bacterium]|nr:hypothetical protein [Planctomycetota bacterium]